MTRIYLDNAATSWPKPEAVYRAVDDYQRRLGAPAGRGSYSEAAETERIVGACRRQIAQLIGATDERRVVFTLNGTDSLNLALHGFLKPGDHVVTTVCEHNSVLRPLRFLAEQRQVSATYVGCDGQGFVSPDDIRRAITSRTRLIALVHASNVTGAIQAVEEVGSIAAEHGQTYLIDAAQSLGCVSIDVGRLGCHLLAAPGHKGLLGPLGTGILYVAPGVEEHLLPQRQGGTGTRSDEDIQPTSLPNRYESGNLNVPGIAGLAAGVSLALQRPAQELPHLGPLTGRLLAGLESLPHVRVYGPPAGPRRVGVVSLNVEGYEPQELASLLDATWQIQTRAGLHCAPRMHAALGTAPRGMLRVSIGPSNTLAQIETLLAALGEISTP